MPSRVARLSLALLVAAGFAACGEDAATPARSTASAGSAAEAAAGRGGSASAGEGGSGSRAGTAGSASNGGEAAGGAGMPADAGAAGAAGAAGGDPFAHLRHLPYPASPYPPENPDSDAKALLGKILFWDEQLSGDDTMACGTCHRPNAGGSDPRSSTTAAAQPGPDQMMGTSDDVHGSPGVVRCNAVGEHTGLSAQVTGRKAPTYLDAMFSARLFWDGRAECSKAECPSVSAFEDPDAPGTFPITSGGALENQAVGPLLSDVEMACEGASWSAIHAKLKSATPLARARQIPETLRDFIAANGASYPRLFQAAFGDAQTSGPLDEINTRRIAFAIATHERRLRSDQTPWDRWNGGDDDALTLSQKRGMEVFVGKGRCEACHRMPLFTDHDFHFIGFHKPSWDAGREAINPELGVPGGMRTPTLRNVGLREATGLLHNGAGAGASLAQIIDLYDSGGLVDDPEVTDVPIDVAIKVLDLTPSEKLDLLDFLKHALEDPRVGAQTAPFDRPLLSTE
jgi:cytochrome c peroxidase